MEKIRIYLKIQSIPGIYSTQGAGDFTEGPDVARYKLTLILSAF